jgi:nitroreductase
MKQRATGGFNHLILGAMTVADLLEIIKGRRSIRKYETRDVTDAMVDQVLEAIRWAPSWTNCQCWEVVVIRDPTIKAQLQATLPPKGNPAANAIVQAPVLLAVCAKTRTSGYYKDLKTTKFGDWMMYDLGLATQNLCLMAHDLGLGTVIVGLFDHDRARVVINVPDGYELVTLIPLGYPAKVGHAPKRREFSVFTHDDHF